MPPVGRRITDLPALIEDLPPEDRVLADRLLDVSPTTGRFEAPEAMRAWIEKSFGSVDAVREQQIARSPLTTTVVWCTDQDQRGGDGKDDP